MAVRWVGDVTACLDRAPGEGDFGNVQQDMTRQMCSSGPSLFDSSPGTDLGSSVASDDTHHVCIFRSMCVSTVYPLPRQRHLSTDSELGTGSL